NQKSCSALASRLAKAFYLLVAFCVVHAAVDLSYLAGVAHALKTVHQKIERVPMLTKDDELFVRVSRLAKNLLKTLKLGFRSLVKSSIGKIGEPADLFALGPQIVSLSGYHPLQNAVLAEFIVLGVAPKRFFISRFFGEHVVFAHTGLHNYELFFSDAAG